MKPETCIVEVRICFGVVVIRIVRAEFSDFGVSKQIGRRPTTKADLPAVFIKYYPSYADGSMTVTELARICGLSRPTVYKYMKMMG